MGLQRILHPAQHIRLLCRAQCIGHLRLPRPHVYHALLHRYVGGQPFQLLQLVLVVDLQQRAHRGAIAQQHPLSSCHGAHRAPPPRTPGRHAATLVAAPPVLPVPNHIPGDTQRPNSVRAPSPAHRALGLQVFYQLAASITLTHIPPLGGGDGAALLAGSDSIGTCSTLSTSWPVPPSPQRFPACPGSNIRLQLIQVHRPGAPFCHRGRPWSLKHCIRVVCLRH